MPGRRHGIGTMLLATLVAAGPLTAVAAPRKQPPPPPPPQGPLAYLKSLLPWTDVGPAPDFVRESRPAETGPFIPAGNDPPEQALRVKTDAELAAWKADLEQARVVHENLRAHPPTLTAATAPPPPPPPPASAKPAAKKRAAKHKPPAAASNN